MNLDAAGPLMPVRPSHSSEEAAARSPVPVYLAVKRLRIDVDHRNCSALVGYCLLCAIAAVAHWHDTIKGLIAGIATDYVCADRILHLVLLPHV
jgi:hypothetical protein